MTDVSDKLGMYLVAGAVLWAAWQAFSARRPCRKCNGLSKPVEYGENSGLKDVQPVPK